MRVGSPPASLCPGRAPLTPHWEERWDKGFPLQSPWRGFLHFLLKEQGLGRKLKVLNNSQLLKQNGKPAADEELSLIWLVNKNPTFSDWKELK